MIHLIEMVYIRKEAFYIRITKQNTSHTWGKKKDQLSLRLNYFNATGVMVRG